MKTNQIEQMIQDSIYVKQQIVNNPKFIEQIQTVANLLTQTFQQKQRVWLCGNGGSAADAQHIASELSGRFLMDRPPLFAEALTVNTSYLTAVANDYGFDYVFARLLEAKATKGDVLIGISTSGNSPNILKAFEKADEIGVIKVGLTGATGGKLKPLSDYLLNVPATHTPRIQEAHILIGHILCALVEQALFGEK